MKKNKLKIGIVGCGVIGEELALFIQKKLFENFTLEYISDKVEQQAVNLKRKLKGKPEVSTINDLIEHSDIIIEAASIEAAKLILHNAIKKRKTIIILSVGALITNLKLFASAQRYGSIIHVPTGAICGVDGIGALSLGKVKEINLTTLKPPRGLKGAPYIIKNKIKLDNLDKEKTVFKGTVFQAIKYFPQNINVAATLFLAAIATHEITPKSLFHPKIKVSIIANPMIKRNIHQILVKAIDANITIQIENIPSKKNPKTSALAILSTQYLLQKMCKSTKIGS